MTTPQPPTSAESGGMLGSSFVAPARTGCQTPSPGCRDPDTTPHHHLPGAAFLVLGRNTALYSFFIPLPPLARVEDGVKFAEGRIASFLRPKSAPTTLPFAPGQPQPPGRAMAQVSAGTGSGVCGRDVRAYSADIPPPRPGGQPWDSATLSGNLWFGRVG